jgi:hypothetical protein
MIDAPMELALLPSLSVVDCPDMPTEPKIVVTGLWGWASKSLGIPPWGQALGLFVALVAFSIGGVLIHIEMTLSGLNSRVDGIPLQIAKDLAARARILILKGKTPQAITTINSSATVISEAAAQHTKAHATYFSELIKELDKVQSVSPDKDLRDSINGVRFELADYRSSIAEIPKLGQSREQTGSFTVEASQKINSAQLGGTAVIRWAGPPGVDMFKSPFVTDLKSAPSIIGGAFVDGQQTLDGFHWENNMFINMHIKYEGREVDLKNVVFINCTFEFVNNERGSQVANYAALAQSSLTIKS